MGRVLIDIRHLYKFDKFRYVMKRKPKMFSKDMAKDEVHNFALSGIGVLVVGLIFILFNGVDWLNISLVILGVLMLIVRTKGMIIFVGILELLFGVYLIIMFAYGSGYTFWRGLIVIGASGYLIWMGISDIQKYYKVKEIFSVEYKNKSSGWKTFFITLGAIFVILFFLGLFSTYEEQELQAFGEQVKDSIVWVSYEVSGKTTDGRYFEGGGASGSGVIYAIDGSKMKVFTNRHVIDCSFGEAYCLERMSEKIKLRTQDGKVHSVSKILYAPHNMDTAILEVNLPSSEKYKPASRPSSFANISENVIAIGYPDAGLEGNYVEFSVSKGKITGTRQIIAQDGFGFEVYDSDAYVNHGSSGGGLFDENGNLIGITTWGSTFGSYSVAIKLDVIDNFDTYITCNNGYPIGDKCFNYCKLGQSLGNDGKCYNICDDYYCLSERPLIDSELCNFKIGYIPGNDGFCHQACTKNTYCRESSICYKNQCVSCPSGTYLFEDGNCREYQ